MEGKEVFGGVDPRADTVGAACATLPGSVQGRESGVVGKERREEMQRLRAEGRTISAIARLTGYAVSVRSPPS